MRNAELQAEGTEAGWQPAPVPLLDPPLSGSDPAGPAELPADPGTPAPPADLPANAGGSGELLKLAAPLIISQSFLTVQVLVDTWLLSKHNTTEMAASFPGVMWYWLGFGLLSVTAGYTSTFVAQYTGAGRPHRVGPAVWQGLYFALIAGCLFMLVAPAAPFLISLGGHDPAVQPLEATYLRCLAFAALPMLIMHAVNGFFSGRGQTWTVLCVEAFGTSVNIALALVLIFGRWGLPEMGIEGAGWATVAGSWASALLGMALFLRKPLRRAYATLSGWKFEPALFGRLMKYGGPAGLQVFLDVLVFHLFTLFVGRLGTAELGATTLAIRFNMIAFLPTMGMGQAVCILVGQRLGADRPDVAERSVYTGLRWTAGYMCLVAAAYLLIPRLLVSGFQPDTADPEGLAEFAAIAAIVPGLLACVAVYCVADAVNLTFAFALRGAGDTRYVTWLTFALAWPIMVVPTYFVVANGGSIYWAWGFATAFIGAMAVCFWFRFRSGKWKSMRVIEPGLAEEENKS